MDRRRLLGTAVAAAGVALIPGRAMAAGDGLAAQVRPYLDRALAAGAPSAVFGVIRGGRRYVAGASQEGPAPDGKTVFQLGSIGKTLTATALARAVGAGRVRLSTPLSLPPGFAVPRGETRRITLRDLATHSSGLPRLPVNLLAEADPYNPYAHYTLEDLAAGLSQTSLGNEPGTAYTYSNLGFGLLGQALAFDGVDAMLQRRVAAPLGLSDTTTTLRPDMASRKATGHMAGEAVPDWRDRVLSGAGTSMYSTVDDMLRYLDAQLRPERSPLRDAIELTQRHHFTDPSTGLRLGLGWHFGALSDGRTMTWHNGGTYGFSTCAAFERKSRTAVVMMVNAYSDASRAFDALVFALLDELVGS
ncbi:serine hydrolase domain-containing protein [Streptomyces leeuwenhoekii]|uniref:Penicillin-binding protein AmpH n=1 Tax=Streptomyces leeuwenhoekii TaxID=1437453 RepID=A0A0F7VKX0_STRLW|nr:serine hydrolase domain-containing protein [Streptomyces leeuwenhoekii]CQR59839.1 Penicillin-binding protein AmpH [Streptomyces leeuwenhoekii]